MMRILLATVTLVLAMVVACLDITPVPLLHPPCDPDAGDCGGDDGGGDDGGDDATGDDGAAADGNDGGDA